MPDPRSTSASASTSDLGALVHATLTARETAGEARAQVRELAARIDAALALHTPQIVCEMYGEGCDEHRDEPPDPLPGIDAPDPYDSHEHLVVCAQCCCGPDGDRGWWCEEHHAGLVCWPCPTAAALGADR